MQTLAHHQYWCTLRFTRVSRKNAARIPDCEPVGPTYSITQTELEEEEEEEIYFILPNKCINDIK